MSNSSKFLSIAVVIIILTYGTIGIYYLFKPYEPTKTASNEFYNIALRETSFCLRSGKLCDTNVPLAWGNIEKICYNNIVSINLYMPSKVKPNSADLEIKCIVRKTQVNILTTMYTTNERGILFLPRQYGKLNSPDKPYTTVTVASEF